MLFINVYEEQKRELESDYSTEWSLNGNLIDLDSYSSNKNIDSISKRLPEKIHYNDCLCFASLNSFFDVYIDEELVYSYIQPENYTGNGYGTAYHSINLSPDQAQKTIKFEVYSAFSSGTGGRLRMISIGNSRNYFARLARGQILPFIISTSIVIIGIILLIFCFITTTKLIHKVNTLALALAAIVIGTLLALDTGFLRLTTDSIIFSRNLYYICMHLDIIFLFLFLYSITKERNKIYLIFTCSSTIMYFLYVLISRFIFNIDMASKRSLHLYFAYLFLNIININIMLIKDRKYRNIKKIERDMGLFYIGNYSLVISFLIDSVIYLSGIRKVSGYVTFSRVGFYAFFLCMAAEVARLWAHEYNSLWKYGYVDELTVLGNRRALIKFEKKNKDIYPFGYAMCDINSLKNINDTYGHDKGDELIKGVAQKLSEVFGHHNVFRVGGDEFIIYSFNTTIDEFNVKIEKAKSLLSEKEMSASIGGVYVNDSSCDIDQYKKSAEEIMYDEKSKYYIANNIDRRR
ncbi:MAG: GGDEF domain-containing protein [Butyrivibrio sp.]|nr:GGDEF domain-containing protein [Butyrivibrio sp.]